MLRVDRHLADAHDERLGIERLARCIRPGRRPGSGRTPAAGEPVEQVLPAEILWTLVSAMQNVVAVVVLVAIAYAFVRRLVRNHVG